jgi:hypothetical protein
VRDGVPVEVPYRSFPNTLPTQEQSPLEPGIRDRKWSAPGIGYVKERAAAGSQERIELVSVTHRWFYVRTRRGLAHRGLT